MENVDQPAGWRSLCTEYEGNLLLGALVILVLLSLAT